MKMQHTNYGVLEACSLSTKFSNAIEDGILFPEAASTTMKHYITGIVITIVILMINFFN
jgi:hypothetical protein